MPSILDIKRPINCLDFFLTCPPHFYYFNATTAPQPTPYAVYATLAVGVLSLIASGLNIYFSSKTAQKVVNLSTKTTREVAELSAQVSRESAGLAVQIARELKEKDYKNDFYKKILDRRLDAWLEAEHLFFPMQGDIYWGPNREVLFGFMCNEEEIKELRKKT